MSYENAHHETRLTKRLREVLKEHQRDGLSMIGNVDKLVGSLARAVESWLAEEKLAEKKSA
jgi:Txe/YoeB family toxin of Txe-Axe toxin-antitoxin module